MKEAAFQEIETAIRSAKRILVASHLRPDADALGSTIAMMLWIHSLGIEAEAWNEDGTPEKFNYLPSGEVVKKPEDGGSGFDMLLALDTSVKNRLGTVLETMGNVSLIINIDHHVSNERFGDLNFIDANSPATGQILFDFLQFCKADITPAMAANLFAAISTDTGSFQYSGTTPHTFEVAAELTRRGVDVAALSLSMYESQPRRRLELLRHALNKCEFSCEDRAVCFSLSLEDVELMKITPEDNEGIIDHLRAVDTVVAAVFFEALPGGKVRVSARSKDPRVDVCKVCQSFGGGGHPLASGARIRGSLEEVKAKFMEVICCEIRDRT